VRLGNEVQLRSFQARLPTTHLVYLQRDPWALPDFDSWFLTILGRQGHGGNSVIRKYAALILASNYQLTLPWDQLGHSDIKWDIFNSETYQVILSWHCKKDIPLFLQDASVVKNIIVEKQFKYIRMVLQWNSSKIGNCKWMTEIVDLFFSVWTRFRPKWLQFMFHKEKHIWYKLKIY